MAGFAGLLSEVIDMCRFAFYLGEPIRLASLVTEPSNSLIHQSFHSHLRQEPLNGDGFGVAWYVPRLSAEPALFKDVSPAWSNANLRELARVTETSCLLAHVRAATPGLAVMRLNCHPFSWGPFAFMHNGVLGGFRSLRRGLLERLSDEAFAGLWGTTDTEVLLALFRDRFSAQASGSSLERMRTALVEAIGVVEELRRERSIGETSSYNLVLTDGARAVATRWISDGGPGNSLFLSTGHSYRCDGGSCRMEPGRAAAVLICSEPLSDEESWREVPDNHLVLVEADLSVTVEPLVF